MQWYYISEGQQKGPVEEADLFKLAKQGDVEPADLVWNQSMGTQWSPASMIPGLISEDVKSVSEGLGATAPVADHHLKMSAQAVPEAIGEPCPSCGVKLAMGVTICPCCHFNKVEGTRVELSSTAGGTAKMKPPPSSEMINTIRGWGFFLFVMGAMYGYAGRVLDQPQAWIWGGVLLVVGTLALLIKHKCVFLLFASVFFFLAAVNGFTGIVSQTHFWTGLAVFQGILGVRHVIHFSSYV